MPRLPRIIIPNIPHHITQRGNRRQQTFFTTHDYSFYLENLEFLCKRFEVEVWAYCLMPNHIHIIAVPHNPSSLRHIIARTHEIYTRYINFKHDWRGYLWQGRFHSCPMDFSHALMAARYIELNPVRAGLVKEAEEYRWSSARAHILGENDTLLTPAPIFEDFTQWRKFLKADQHHDVEEQLKTQTRTGRPLGSEKFLKQIETQTGLLLTPQRRGPKVKFVLTQ